jgi:LmbE family N-acetylglucosaminyl deacetylase
MNRRAFLKDASLAFAPAALLAPIGPAQGQQRSLVTHSPLKIVCVGGHPDDPESGCAGTLARYAQLGHSVTIIYLTRGERGIRGRSLEEAAQIRTGESEAACQIMGAKAVFAGQTDGDTELNRARVDAFAKLLAAEAPDLLFTHWPVDTHMDHQIASLLAQRAAAALSKQPQVYFFEVNTGSQSQGFTPNVYVDISSVVEKKKAALFAHKSQNGEAIWRDHHEPIARFRGREAGVAFAEAFVHLNRDNKTGVLPGLSLLGP